MGVGLVEFLLCCECWKIINFLIKNKELYSDLMFLKKNLEDEAKKNSGRGQNVGWRK